MRDPLSELGHLRKLAKTDPTKRFDKLYRLVCAREILAIASERVSQNTGGTTAGIDGQTRKQINTEMLATLANELRQDRYHPQAVRRAYIPKGKKGRRALGMPMVRSYCPPYQVCSGLPCQRGSDQPTHAHSTVAYFARTDESFDESFAVSNVVELACVTRR
jgi:hypothetical protein